MDHYFERSWGLQAWRMSAKVWKWGESTLTCRNEIVPFIGDIWELAFAIPAFGVISHLTWTSLKEPRCRCTSRDNVAPSWTTLIPSDIAFVNLQFKEVTFNYICLNIWEKETWKVTPERDLRHENCDAMTGAVLHQLSYPQLKDVFHISNIDLHLQLAGTADPGEMDCVPQL